MTLYQNIFGFLAGFAVIFFNFIILHVFFKRVFAGFTDASASPAQKTDKKVRNGPALLIFSSKLLIIFGFLYFLFIVLKFNVLPVVLGMILSYFVSIFVIVRFDRRRET